MGALGRPNILIGRFTQWLAHNYSFDLAGDAPVVIVGSGRSGTTWLAALCNYQNRFRYIFEPLNPIHSGADLASWSPEPRDSCPVLESVLQGRNASKWSLGFNRKAFARERLIKEIRLNLALQWVAENYPDAKLVKIVRNPLAVAASKKSLAQREDGQNWVWEPCLADLLADPGVKAKLTTEQFERLAVCVGQGQVVETIADWCLNNLVVEFKGFTVWYENLRKQPVHELRKLFNFLDIPFHENVLEQIDKPSSTFRLARDDSKFELTENRWLSVLSTDEIKASTELLQYFGVERFYTPLWQPTNSTHA